MTLQKLVKISARTQYILSLLAPKKEMSVLNIGISNIPEIEIELEKCVKECVTLDFDKKKLEKATPFLKKTKLVQGDIHKPLPFKKNYFDAIIILEVLEHVDDRKALQMLIPHLKKGGVVIVAVPNMHPLHIINPVLYFEHKRHYSNAKIRRRLEEAGCKVEELNVVENWTLLANLYVHLFNKHIMRKQRVFGTFTKSAAKTYERRNKHGLDIIVKARKI
ncbi:MAG: class I SAM-dependent methyltransferase [Nanoarchaeota archaeon]